MLSFVWSKQKAQKRRPALNYLLVTGQDGGLCKRTDSGRFAKCIEGYTRINYVDNLLGSISVRG